MPPRGGSPSCGRTRMVGGGGRIRPARCRSCSRCGRRSDGTPRHLVSQSHRRSGCRLKCFRGAPQPAADCRLIDPAAREKSQQITDTPACLPSCPLPQAPLCKSALSFLDSFRAGPMASLHVLDTGCGSGGFLSLFAESVGATCTAATLSGARADIPSDDVFRSCDIVFRSDDALTP